MAVFKAQQKEKREWAYANLARCGEEFIDIAKFFLPCQQNQECMEERRKLAKMPKIACGRFKDWLRQRSPWLADIWRLRRTLQSGTQYGHFHEDYFPEIGKLQKSVIPYCEKVRRRNADMKVGMSRLEASRALPLRCVGQLASRWRKKCGDIPPRRSSPTSSRPNLPTCNGF